MTPKNLLLPLMLSLTFGLFAQTPSPTKQSEEDAKLEKAALELLRETSTEVGRLRTVENRISFEAELASLMWFHDDKEAKLMYGGVVSDFKQLLSQLNAELNSPVSADEELEAGIFNMYGRTQADRKLRIALEVRKQIAMSLAEHAPDLAFNFFYDSLNLITDPEMRKQTETGDKYFETQLVQQIAQSNAERGVEYGKESIKKGLDATHVDLLRKIYAKDADKGIDFGAAVLSRLKSDDAAKKNVYIAGSLLSFGDEIFTSKKPDNKPVYDASDMRDIAEILAGQMLQDNNDDQYAGSQYITLIAKYSPGRAAQIKAKQKRYAAAMSANSMKVSNVNTAFTVEETENASNSNAAWVKTRDEREARDKAEKQMFDDIKDLGTKPLAKEERDKIVARSRSIIARTPGKDKKLTALCALAAEVAHAGDKELANEIMADAERYVNPQPKNYQDFLMSWMLASGYAETNPDKAFPLLENTILRANDTIAAFIKVAEFIDVQEEMVSDGEVQVGMFGGSMVRGMTSELGLASAPIRSLARADFQKTVNLTNTFDHTEIRVLAKMLVLRSVLDTGAKSDIQKQMEEKALEDSVGG